ncbi:MAG: V4R domain-containing protein [Methanobacteriaceae archaeon]|jgi:predicted hydrocarbon binding protein
MDEGKISKKNKKTDVKLFSTPEGVSVIKSPTKTQILTLLGENGMSFDRIVEHTGRSKSTVSEHLQSLVDHEIIDYRHDLKDRRRKIFYIKSRHLGDISPVKELEEGAEKYFSGISDYRDPFEFFRLMFRTIRIALLKEGINIDPLLHQAGIKVGEAVYKGVEAHDINKFIQNIAEFWECNKLGRIEVKSLDPLIINAYDCFECEDLPKIGRSACAFDSGVLEAIFSRYFGHDVDAEEVKCYAMGDKYCSFVIKEKNTG